MFKKISLVGMVIMTITGMSAVRSDIMLQQQERITQTNREAISNSRSFFRESKNRLVRNSQLNQIIIQKPNWGGGEDEWWNDEMVDFYYDESGRLTMFTFSFWHEDDEDDYLEWSPPLYKASLEWMRNGLISTLTYSRLDFFSEEEEWIDIMVWEQQFNDNDQIEFIIMLEFDEDSEEWIKEGYISFSYDEEGMLRHYMFNFFDDDDDPERWNDMWRLSFVYDENGRIEEVYHEYKDFYDDEWMVDDKSGMQYHHSDESTYSTVQNFFNKFVLNMSLPYSGEVNPIGKIEYETYYEYQDWHDEWVSTDREAFSYNDQNIVISREGQCLEGEEWIAENRTLYTYDEDWNLIEALDQFLHWGGIDWIRWERMLLFYAGDSSVEDCVTKPQKLNGFNFPNPFNPMTTINFSTNSIYKTTIDIYNAKGQLVRTLADDYFPTGNHSVVWNGTDSNGRELSSGVYFFRILTETDHASGKMLMVK